MAIKPAKKKAATSEKPLTDFFDKVPAGTTKKPTARKPSSSAQPPKSRVAAMKKAPAKKTIVSDDDDDDEPPPPPPRRTEAPKRERAIRDSDSGAPTSSRIRPTKNANSTQQRELGCRYLRRFVKCAPKASRHIHDS